MIRDSETIVIGRFNKPHGINGEISATLLYDGLDLRELKCIVVKMDSINVPFFIDAVRPKGPESVLLTIDGFNNEKEAAALANKDIFALLDELDIDEDADGEGGYAVDFIGYTITDPSGAAIGTIADVDDSTENVLFIVDGADGREILIPVADEFFEAVDPEAKTLTVNLPEGLI